MYKAFLNQHSLFLRCRHFIPAWYSQCVGANHYTRQSSPVLLENYFSNSQFISLAFMEVYRFLLNTFRSSNQCATPWMNCLTLTSRSCKFTSFFGVVFQSEYATKSVFLCVKWRAIFPACCYSYQHKTCCIGLQHFNGSLYWGRKTYEVKSDFPEMVHAWRELCSIWRKGIYFGLSILLLAQHSSSHIAVPLRFCADLLSSCCAELHGTRVFAGISAAAQEMLSSGVHLVCNWQKGSS